MTTIVIRDGIMAADTRAYSGTSTPIGFKRKVHRLPDGTLVGVSSTEPGQAEAFIEWLRDPSEGYVLPSLNVAPKLQALVMRPSGEVFYYNDSLACSGPLTGDFHAIGSGEQYALGALTCGATADAAVMVAAQHDPWTGGEIQQIEWSQEKPKAKKEKKKKTEVHDAVVVETE